MENKTSKGNTINIEWLINVETIMVISVKKPFRFENIEFEKGRNFLLSDNDPDRWNAVITSGAYSMNADYEFICNAFEKV